MIWLVSNMKFFRPESAMILMLFAPAAKANDLQTLEGKPTPALEASVWFGPKQPRSRACVENPCCCFSGRIGARGL
jgi:hypothetical protein